MTTGPSGKWDDLLTRLASGAIMAIVGVTAMLAGGPWFAVLSSVVSGVMIWEVLRMTQGASLAHRSAIAAAALATAVVLAALWLPPTGAPFLLVAFVAVSLVTVAHNRLIYSLFALAILIAGWSLVVFRETYGTVWLFWLVFVVIATDVFGYFGGRLIGGPKFWPRVSPKKTWAGILAGWAASALLGAVFLLFTNAGRDLVWISMLTSFASQLGDIAESALKRRMGVKDSSTLIPGHGGLFDRFDGLLGATLFMMLTALIVDVPEVRF